LTITNSTISDNDSGIYPFDDCGNPYPPVHPTLRITNSTIGGNDTGIEYLCSQTNVADNVTLTSSIVANDIRNCSRFLIGGAECGRFSSGGHNISDDETCDELIQTSDLSNVDAALGPLADNGGPTMTHDLLPGSPAIDAIPLADCFEPFDQRGAERPQGSACDVGAVELVPEPAAIALQLVALFCISAAARRWRA
jgi:hypothetical protein